MTQASLERLLALVPPPVNACCTGTESERMEIEESLSDLGVTLPHGVAELSAHYGRGAFTSSDFCVSVHSIFQRGYTGLVRYNSCVFAGLAKSESPDPYQNMFEVGAYGYIHGDDYGTARLFVDTSGIRDSWCVGLGVPLQRFNVSLVDFLLGVVEKRIRPAGFPDAFTDLAFVPHQPSGG